MTFILIFLAVSGWLAAFILMSIVMVLSLAFGASLELDGKAKQGNIDTNNPYRTKVWSMNKEKEIPFGD